MSVSNEEYDQSVKELINLSSQLNQHGGEIAQIQSRSKPKVGEVVDFVSFTAQHNNPQLSIDSLKAAGQQLGEHFGGKAVNAKGYIAPSGTVFAEIRIFRDPEAYVPLSYESFKKDASLDIEDGSAKTSKAPASVKARTGIEFDKTVFQSAFVLDPQCEGAFKQTNLFKFHDVNNPTEDLGFIETFACQSVGASLDDLLSSVEDNTKMRLGNRSSFRAFRLKNGVSYIESDASIDMNTADSNYYLVVPEKKPSPS